MLVIGLTGGIGSGKSTACGIFAELGAPVIDADTVARELVEPGGIALQRIIAEFGPGVLDTRGRLDRGRMRALVFGDDAQRERLESILHPLIRAEIQRRIAGLDAPYCIVAIPLLVEKGWVPLVDRVLVIDIPDEQRIERVQARDRVSAAQVEAIMATQVPRGERLAVADDVIENVHGLDHLHRAVESLHRRYTALSTRAET